MRKITYFFILVMIAIQLYAIQKNDSDLYDTAVQLFNQEKYKQAIRIAQSIEDLYPLSYCAMQAKLLVSIARYNMGEYSNAANELDEYIFTYPNSEDLEYAFYLRILAYYMKINKVKLEQSAAYKTLELATEYINFFPNGEYIEDITNKVKLVTEHIAAKECSIGQFYFKRGEYLAAIKRFQNILENYKDSIYLSQSIKYLVGSYSALGLDLEAEQYTKLLPLE
ncbi:outer membrane protein assembly factor BamD [Wolbachia pipientis]|uniref:Outer membrane protein assembly factor BamD n=2 Tax=Wolbachia pipientis TaxID=955 RepID=A0A1E7QJ81_WOLPI|nr:outer membrane protein assembly factor BamD [Wolbachia pipientis]OEY86528.1 outer membrane protein assembly factor BamD [Wolbachia pipientis]